MDPKDMTTEDLRSEIVTLGNYLLDTIDKGKKEVGENYKLSKKETVHVWRYIALTEELFNRR